MVRFSRRRDRLLPRQLARRADDCFSSSATLANYKILTALAASNASVASEIAACTIISNFAHRDNTGTSVGEKAVLVLKARNR